MEYDDKKRLIMVICDGNIVGSGNEKSTPKIVLDLLGVDPEMEPPSRDAIAVAEGSMMHNRGKVYSGLYDYEGHLVPFVVVVKVGNRHEKNKPGNRGKRDSQILLMRFLNKVYFELPMTPLELELNHHMTHIIGIPPQYFEYLLQVDADTVVGPESMSRLVAHCVADNNIAGICGETRIANEQNTWVTMVQVVVFLIRGEWQHIGWLIIYLLSFPLWSFVLPIYSFWHFDDFSWGNTRTVVGERGKIKLIVANDYQFNIDDIPLITWSEYEANLIALGTVNSPPQVNPSYEYAESYTYGNDFNRFSTASPQLNPHASVVVGAVPQNFSPSRASSPSVSTYSSPPSLSNYQQQPSRMSRHQPTRQSHINPYGTVMESPNILMSEDNEPRPSSFIQPQQPYRTTMSSSRPSSFIQQQQQLQQQFQQPHPYPQHHTFTPMPAPPPAAASVVAPISPPTPTPIQQMQHASFMRSPTPQLALQQQPVYFPSDQQIIDAIKLILSQADLTLVSKKIIRDSLSAQFGVDMTPKKTILLQVHNADSIKIQRAKLAIHLYISDFDSTPQPSTESGNETNNPKTRNNNIDHFVDKTTHELPTAFTNDHTFKLLRLDSYNLLLATFTLYRKGLRLFEYVLIFSTPPSTTITSTNTTTITTITATDELAVYQQLFKFNLLLKNYLRIGLDSAFSSSTIIKDNVVSIYQLALFTLLLTNSNSTTINNSVDSGLGSISDTTASTTASTTTIVGIGEPFLVDFDYIHAKHLIGNYSATSSSISATTTNVVVSELPKFFKKIMDKNASPSPNLNPNTPFGSSSAFGTGAGAGFDSNTNTNENNISWRAFPNSISYLNNSFLLEITETIDIKYGTSSTATLFTTHPKSLSLSGQIVAISRVSGSPSLSLKLTNNGGGVIDDGYTFGFHRCVLLKNWIKYKTIDFIPPDKSFILADYFGCTNRLVNTNMNTNTKINRSNVSDGGFVGVDYKFHPNFANTGLLEFSCFAINNGKHVGGDDGSGNWGLHSSISSCVVDIYIPTTFFLANKGANINGSEEERDGSEPSISDFVNNIYIKSNKSTTATISLLQSPHLRIKGISDTRNGLGNSSDKMVCITWTIPSFSTPHSSIKAKPRSSPVPQFMSKPSSAGSGGQSSDNWLKIKFHNPSQLPIHHLQTTTDTKIRDG
ncbi:Chitin synthase 8 [Zancudomyces culisetae]|uniref:chitin synthase n=1 Tax=Zancudomyces culisetae TaxID=1213189 RepID=A0A1R1PVA6_ZANCU|nr:Chitin synthase 8 [Zancudomyces culisetae]|eukprot:OMH84907.1 Chitin synthase 8 [Zancudomyces culisetae]